MARGFMDVRRAMEAMEVSHPIFRKNPSATYMYARI
jgi:hypothetical protein